VGTPLLDRLFPNPMRYIARWVANHVNDISKTDPHVALEPSRVAELRALEAA
jgi:hypothetical protein